MESLPELAVYVENGDEDLLVLDDGCGGGSSSAKARRCGMKGAWSPEEDAILSHLVGKFGAKNWSLIARGIAGRSDKSCRLRWCNHLNPAVNRKPFTYEEDQIIVAGCSCNPWEQMGNYCKASTGKNR